MDATRRRLIGAAGLAALSSACASRKRAASLPATPRAAAPRAMPDIDVRPERVIRTICGLWQYRPSGFVLRAGRIGDKLVVVHNYGHAVLSAAGRAATQQGQAR